MARKAKTATTRAKAALAAKKPAGRKTAARHQGSVRTSLFANPTPGTVAVASYGATPRRDLTRVHLLKQHFAAAIDLLYKELDGKAPLPSEQRRLYGTAITEAQTAQMWAVKAVTFRG